MTIFISINSTLWNSEHDFSKSITNHKHLDNCVSTKLITLIFNKMSGV